MQRFANLTPEYSFLSMIVTTLYTMLTEVDGYIVQKAVECARRFICHLDGQSSNQLRTEDTMTRRQFSLCLQWLTAHPTETVECQVFIPVLIKSDLNETKQCKHNKNSIPVHVCA